jgi:hypothetical protein
LLGKAAASTRDHIFAIFAPELTRIVDAITERVAGFRIGMLNIAVDLNEKFKPIVNDIVAVIEGRDADVQNSSILKFKDAVVQAGQDISAAINNLIIPAFFALLRVLEMVSTAINAVFGTQLTGGELLAAAALLRLTGLMGALWESGKLLVTMIGLLVAAFGAWPVVIAAVGFALGFLITNHLMKLGPVLASVVESFAAAWNGIAQKTDELWKAIKQSFSNGVAAVVDFFTSIPDGLAAAWDSIVQSAKDTWGAIVQGATEAGNGIADALRAGVDAALVYVKDLYDSVVQIFNNIISKTMSVASAVASALNGGGGDVSGAQANARGGYIRGPGTGTSDSILSWLSNGEFVIRAEAVKKWGLGFFQALNALREPGGGFAQGGLVQAATAMLPPIPRFAMGGPVVAGAGAGGRPFTLQIGGEEFGGMTATDDAVSKLERYAVRQQVRSAGRKPQWFRG